MSDQEIQEQSIDINSMQQIDAEGQPVSEETQEETAAKTLAEVVEKKAEEAAPKQEDKLSAKFAALSRKEKQLRERERSVEAKLKQMEDQFKTKETEYTSKYINPDRLKREPLKVLEEMGLNFNQLAEMVVNDGKPTAEMQTQELENKLSAKLKELEDKLAEKEAKEQEAKYERTLQNFMEDITETVNNNNDYELIRANDSVDLVYTVIEEHHANTGAILTIKEAADAVESYLLEEAKKQLSLGKIKGLLTPQVQPETPKAKPSVTLSNTASAQVSKPTGGRFLSDEQSKLEAAKLIKWEE